jgi:glycosyltransferase involved in cell wall biosynthesis
MYIAFISTGYYPSHSGGASISTRLIVDQLRSFGHSVDVYTATGEETNSRRIDDDHVEFPDGTGYRLPTRVGKNYGALKHLDDLLAYDVVHVYGLGVLPGVVARTETPVLGTVNNLAWVCINWVEYLRADCPEYGLREAVMLARQDGYGPATLPLKLLLEGTFKRFAKCADQFTVQNEGMKTILSRCGYPESKLTVVPNLLDRRFLCESDEKQRQIVSVGRLIEKKGVDDLVQAYIDLPEKLRNEFSLKLYGDGPLKQPITELASRTGADIEIGYQPYEKLPAVYRKASVMVQGSKYPEPFSRTWLEAMASETAIVCSANPSSRAVLGGIAELYDPFDPQTLQRALETVLNDEAYRATLAGRGKAAVSQFEPETVVSEYVSLYEQLLDSKKRTDE